MVQTLTTNLNNELYQDKFKLVFKEIKNTEILCISANIPGVTGTPVAVPNSLNNIFVPANKLQYDQLTIQFKVDEDLKTYKEIYAWILAIYHPQNYEQFAKFQEEISTPRIRGNKYGFDASLMTLSNALNVNVELNFVNLFPTSLSSIDFNLISAAKEDHVTATATFQYDYYKFK